MESVTISESAAKRIGEILKTEPDGAMLRVSRRGGAAVPGFSTSSILSALEGRGRPVLSRDGAVVLIDPVSVNYMAGSQIDFVDDLIGQLFKINNPQATASCGCGTSFSL